MIDALNLDHKEAFMVNQTIGYEKRIWSPTAETPASPFHHVDIVKERETEASRKPVLRFMRKVWGAVRNFFVRR